MGTITVGNSRCEKKIIRVVFPVALVGFRDPAPMRYDATMDRKFPATLSNRKVAASCKHAARNTSHGISSATLRIDRKARPMPKAMGTSERFFAISVSRRLTGRSTSARKPSRSNPN